MFFAPDRKGQLLGVPTAVTQDSGTDGVPGAGSCLEVEAAGFGEQSSSKAAHHRPVEEAQCAGEPFSEKARLPSHETGKAPNSTDAATHDSVSGA